MGILQTFIIVLFCICSALLILFVMLQSGKGGGLNLVGGGNTGMQPQTMDTITKITWVTGVIFFVLAILAAIAFADAGPGKMGEPDANNAELPIPISQEASDKASTDTNTKNPKENLEKKGSKEIGTPPSKGQDKPSP